MIGRRIRRLHVNQPLIGPADPVQPLRPWSDQTLHPVMVKLLYFERFGRTIDC